MLKQIEKNSDEFLLNTIGPYFTMFPLRFPYQVMRHRALKGEVVLDPFCGRGTTNFAARVLGLSSVGVDSSPIAVALTEAKLVSAYPGNIIKVARNILEKNTNTFKMPNGEFWRLLYAPNVLRKLCCLREALLEDCESDARKALRGIILGVLHGPLHKTVPSYLSNQCPRTYAPKPNYAIRFWKENQLLPPDVDLLSLISRKAKRYYTRRYDHVDSVAIKGDSRDSDTFTSLGERKVGWVITSPPYYGMSTYIADQWLRNWFLGGPPEVAYEMRGQLKHSSPEVFKNDLRKVWCNAKKVSTNGAKLVIRFGSINSKRVDTRELIKSSLRDSGWRIITINEAGNASMGKRQLLHFSKENKRALTEYDVWARAC